MFEKVSGYAVRASQDISTLIGAIGNDSNIPQFVKNELTEMVVRLDSLQDIMMAVAFKDKEQLDFLTEEYKSQGFKKTIDHHIETQDKPLPWLPYKKIDLLKQQFSKDETFLVLDYDKGPWTAYYEDGRWLSDDFGTPIKGVTHYMRIDYPPTEE